VTEHEDIKASIKKQTQETQARIDADVQKLKDRPEYDMLPSMVKCYIDILIINIDLLKQRDLNAQNHIDRLDEMIDELKAHTS
jgi:hypothetical protein